MLTNLHVKNLALIDEAEVEFGPGLNILTGETGAGKSILIGSINAALGKKISREMIRTGETSALVELVFETENPHVLELLKEMDLEAEEGQVIISRKITGSRSVCRINGEACNISQVKALASLLLDIHGQHEHQSLLYPDRQIAILDAFAGTEAATAKGEVRALYQEWKNVRKELSAESKFFQAQQQANRVAESHQAYQEDPWEEFLESKSIDTYLGQLSDDQVEVISLHYRCDLSVKETARLMERTDGSVKTLLHRARSKLLDLLVTSDPGVYGRLSSAMVEPPPTNVISLPMRRQMT